MEFSDFFLNISDGYSKPKATPKVQPVDKDKPKKKVTKKTNLPQQKPPDLSEHGPLSTRSFKRVEEPQNVKAATKNNENEGNRAKFSQVVNDRKRSANGEMKSEPQSKKPKSNYVAKELAACKVPLAFSGAVTPHASAALFMKENFCDLGIFHPHLVACLQQRLQITNVSAIQKSTFPAMLSGRDCLVKSQTGSGKTIAYALPILQMMQAIEPPVDRHGGLLALVITPTQELALQTHETFVTLCQPFVRLVPGCLVGGVTMKSQKKSIRKGLNIIIATPQRLLEHIRHTASLEFTHLRWLVLDEADRMLEMGYQTAVAEILQEIRRKLPEEKKLQSVLVSATLTAGVEQLAALSLHNPLHCISAVKGTTKKSSAKAMMDGSVSDNLNLDEVSDMPAGLQHFVMLVPTKLRLVALASFLLLKCRFNRSGGKVIVFLQTQHSVDFHHTLFQRLLKPQVEATVADEEGKEQLKTKTKKKQNEIEMFKLHGNIEHKERHKTFQAFRACHNGILFTTDVASRGVDISCVAWVVQYNPPANAVDYIHRVGRTARAGGKGKAVLFLNPEEKPFVQHLEEKLSLGGARLQALSLPLVLKLCYQKEEEGRAEGKGGKEKRYVSRTNRRQAYEERCTTFQRQCESAVAQDEELKALAEKAYISFIRSYATFSQEMRTFFVFGKLHLGHAAKSFGLCETPKEIANKMKKRGEDAPGGETKWKRNFNSGTNTRSAGGRSVPRQDHAKRNMLAEFGVW